MSPVVGIDVGASLIKGVVFDEGGVAVRHARITTPHDDRTGVSVADGVAALSRELSEDVEALGLAAPGVVDADKGVVEYSRNLGWNSVPLLELVAARVEAPVFFGHDVRLGALAEHSELSPEQQIGTSIFVPIGTGISIAVTRNGVPASRGGWSGEIGGMRTSVDKSRTLEEIASAAGIARSLRQPDGESVLRLVEAGDAGARRAWDEAIDALAEALAWSVALLGAEHVVVGGGLSGAGALLIDPLAAALTARVGDLPAHTVQSAVLGDLAGCHGAAMMASQASRT